VLPFGLCINHGNLLEKCRRSLTYFSPTRIFRVWTRAIPCFNTLTVQGGVRLVRGDMSRAGCGRGPPRIAYSQNGALDLANASHRAQGTRIEYCRRTI